MTRSPPEPERPWYGLGKVLPTRTRRRVFDPFYYDLLAARGDGRDLGLGLRVALAVVGTAGVGLACWARGLGRAARMSLVVVVTAVVMILVGRSYSEESGPPSGNDDSSYVAASDEAGR